MKEIWKKIDYFMLTHGGYALLIATVATVAFFAVLQWANNYVQDKTTPLEITLNEDGTLSVDYQYDDKDRVYILWETDGGNITADDKSGIFGEQDGKYYAYSLSNEYAYWNPEDADGNCYSTATVRATLYVKDEENIYKPENYVMAIDITLMYEDGKITQADDRVFGNPVRQGSDENWSQIYCIQETEDILTFRYRTGEKIDTDSVLILYWEAEDEILSETDYANGFYPECTLSEDNQDQKSLKAVSMISCKKEKLAENEKISACLINEEAYQSDTVKEEDKANMAEVVIGR
jgi:hypothetical protein